MRVLLVDDHQLFRAGLESPFTVWGHEVVGNAGDGIEAVAQARALQPDLVLMDINLPKVNGLEATRLIKAEMPDIKIVMVTVSDDHGPRPVQAPGCTGRGRALRRPRRIRDGRRVLSKRGG